MFVCSCPDDEYSNVLLVGKNLIEARFVASFGGIPMKREVQSLNAVNDDDSVAKSCHVEAENIFSCEAKRSSLADALRQGELCKQLYDVIVDGKHLTLASPMSFV